VTRDPYSLVHQEHLLRLFSALAINCVLDVGSSSGEFASSLRLLGYPGRIVSFEPVGRNFEVLKQHCIGDPDWRAYRVALGASRGSVEIQLYSGATFHSFLGPSEYGRTHFPDKMQTEGTEVVRLDRLDNLFDKCIEDISHPRVFLKIDTQGYDLEVVRGLGAKVNQVAALQVEVAITPIYANATNSFLDLIAHLQTLGFRLSGMFPVTFDPANENCLLEFDCVMCRTERPVS
jgi:FkbM family methyltransferase